MNHILGPAHTTDSNYRSMWFPWLIIVSLGVLAILVMISYWKIPYVGMFAIATGNVEHVIENGPAWEAGLRPGDRFVSIDGLAPGEFLERGLIHGIGDVVPVSFERSGRRIDSRLILTPYPAEERLTLLLLISLGAAYVLLGATPFLQSQVEVSRRFFFLCAAVAISLWVLPLAQLRVTWAHHVIYFSVIVSGLALLRFHAIFPAVTEVGQGRGLSTLSTFVLALAVTYLVVGPYQVDSWIGRDISATLARLLYAAMALAALGLLLSQYRQGSGDARRRIRLIVGGSLLAYLPVVVVLTASVLNAYVSENLAVVSLVAIPIVYVGSILKTDLMEADYKLYRVLVYLTLAAVLLAIYLAVIEVIEEVTSANVAFSPLTGGAVALLLVALVGPVERSIVRPVVGRFFYGRGYDYLEIVTSSAARFVGRFDTSALVEELTQTVPAAMGVVQAGLWLRTDDPDDFPWVGGTSDIESAGAAQLFRTRLKQLRDGQLIPLHSGSAGNSQLQARWLVPLALGGALHGVWMIGARRNDESFGPLDRRLIEASANQAALVARLHRQLAISERDREELRQAYVRVTDSRESERRRIASELHDDIIQALLGYRYQLKQFRNLTTEEHEKALIEAINRSNSIIRDIRRICENLLPAPLFRTDVWSALDDLASGLQEAGMAVDLVVPKSQPDVTDALAITLFRIVQEALNNVRKHARASSVSVRIEMSPSATRLTVADDGQGFDPRTMRGNRLGIISMRERANAAGGTLEVLSRPERPYGTLVVAQLPNARGNATLK